MGNLIKMDLYRMQRSRSYLVILILVALSALVVTPAAWALGMLARVFSDETSLLPKTAELTGFIADPFPFLNAMLIMIAASHFFYADIEFGYIKNIAGQMPKKGYTVLSKFIVIMVQNLFFMALGVICSLIGTLFFQRIVLEGDLGHALLVFCLKFLLLQGCCSILLLFVTSLRNKSMGSVLSVLMGTGLLFLVYMGIDSALGRVFRLGSFSVADYMPDQLLRQSNPDTLRAFLVAAVTIAIFLPLSIRVFDRRDVK